jgi:GNAT superfamily N-acetyltransferase
MENTLIRKATLNDLDTLLVFEQGLISAERPFENAIKKDPTRYYDIEKMINSSEMELVVAMLGDELVGCGYARIENARHYLQHPLHAYLGFMYTVPAHRGKGINKMIINELALWAASKDMTVLTLEVYYGNKDAIRAYENAGFTKNIVEMRKELK